MSQTLHASTLLAVPLAGVNRSVHLLVLGPAAALPDKPDEPVADDVAKKGGKSRARR